jgi:integrase
MLEKEFLDWLKNRVNEKTYKNYLSILNNLEISTIEISNLPASELGKKLTNFIGKKWTRLFAVKNLLLFYNRTDVYPYLPTPKFIEIAIKDRVKDREKRHKNIPINVIRKVVREVENEELKLMIMLQYETGARISELLNITRDDIFSYDDRKITIAGEKGSEGRTIMLSNVCFDLLVKRLPTPFTHKYWWYWNEMKKAFSKYGYNISTHCLRFSRAIHLLNKGVEILILKDLLGHKDLQSTYAYLKEAGINLDKLFKGKAVGMVEW